MSRSSLFIDDLVRVRVVMEMNWNVKQRRGRVKMRWIGGIEIDIQIADGRSGREV